MKDWISLYAAFVSTVVAIIQYSNWRSQRTPAQLTVLPRTEDKHSKKCICIEIDIQTNQNSTDVTAIYLAAYKSKLHYWLNREPDKVIPSTWNEKMFPEKIELGHGWEGLLPLNDKERALAASYKHIRLMVRHTGNKRVLSEPVTKYLRT